MLAMMLRPAGRVIDGTFLARGQWTNVTASKTVNGFFVGTIFLRGGGRGRGGDTNTNLVASYGRVYGEYGGSGASAEHTSQAMSSPVITIGSAGTNGVDTTASNSSGTYNGGTPSSGGSTTAVYGGVTRSAAGGTLLGTPAQLVVVGGTVFGWSEHDPFAKAVTNPNGGNYGRGGGYTNSGGNPGTSLPPEPGVVQIKLED